VSAAALPAIASALAVLIVGIVLVLSHELGPLSAHMVLHIAMMNVAAPLAAILLAPRKARVRARIMWAFAIAQIAFLWMWHAPALQRQILNVPALQLVMHASLLAVAFGFWTALIRLDPEKRWQLIAVLLVTAKLSCLPAVLLIFAPRALYESTLQEHAVHAAWLSGGLEDQQLAGLVMVSACPLSYVVAGVIVTAQLLHRPAVAHTQPTSVSG
jgi:putative membrane protein